MRWSLIIVVVLIISIPVSGAEKVKLLTSFEPEQLKNWRFKKFEEKDGVYWISNNTVLAKGDATQGEWAWKRAVSKKNVEWGGLKKGTSPEWMLYFHGTLFNAIKRFPHRSKGQWFPGDWSGYGRLRLDVRSTKSKARLRVQLYDEIALPPVRRIFNIPKDKWVTVDLDMAAASKLYEMKLCLENQKIYGVKTAKVRTFNPAKMANIMLVVEQCDEATDFLFDNLRLVADPQAEKPAHDLVTDSRPYPEPKELLPSKPEPRKAAVPGKKGTEEVSDKVIEVDPELKGKSTWLNELVRHAITAVDKDRIAFVQGLRIIPRFTLDGGKTWKNLKQQQHSSNAPGVGIGASGPDILALYTAKCPGGGRPIDVFFREIRFNGKEWAVGDIHLADIDSWHCPEYKVEILRVKSGRIWAAWMDCDRFYSYHSTIRARYSDDGGKIWRDPDSNGLAMHTVATNIKEPMPIGVTWWWEKPAITPLTDKANGHIDKCHPHTNLSITSYKEHIAVIYCTPYDRLSYCIFDGSKWSDPQVIVKQFGGPGCASTLGEKEIHFIFRGKVYRLDNGKWIEDSPAAKGPAKLTACGDKIICIGKKVTQNGDKQISELWYSLRTSGNAWSAPKFFAKEETPKGRAGSISIIAPQFSSVGFVPVAWAPPKGLIKIKRLAVK